MSQVKAGTWPQATRARLAVPERAALSGGFGPQRCGSVCTSSTGRRGNATSSVSGVLAVSSVVCRASCISHSQSGLVKKVHYFY